MSFGAPEMLWVLWTLPVIGLLFAWGMVRRRRIMARFADPAATARLTRGASSWRRWFKAGCLMACAAALALALARPQIGFHWKEIERKGVEIMVALDCSRSMLAEDVKPSRLKRAKREIVDLVNMLEGDRIGLTAFAGTAFVQCPLTLDYTALNLFLNVMGPEQMPVGGTDLAAAVNTALDGFDPHSDADKGIILITDGESTVGDPIKAAERAKEKGVRIFTVGVGADQGAPVPEKKGSGFKRLGDGSIKVSRLDEETLRKMAEITGGRYVRSVTGDMDLETIYLEGIRQELEAKTLKSGREKVMDERFQWFLGAALVFLLLDLFTGPGVRNGKKTAFMVLVACVFMGGVPAWAGMEEGVRAYEQEKYDQAAERMIDAQLGAPDEPDIFYNLGNAYYRQGEYEKARDNFAAALKGASPELRAKAMYNLGNAEYRLDRFEEAERAYERALEFTPDDKDARQNLELARRRKEMQKQQQQQQNQQNQQGGQSPHGEKKDGSDSQGKNDQNGQKSESGEGRQGEQDEQGAQSGDDSGQDGKQSEKRAGDKSDRHSGDRPENQDGQQDGQQGKDGEQPEGRDQAGGKEGAGAQGEQEGDRQDGDEESGEDGTGSGKLEEMPGEQPEKGAGAGSDEESEEENVDRFSGRPQDESQSGGDEPQGGRSGRAGEQQNVGRQGRGMRSDVLNRVKDKPGMGMVPSYGRRNVEKDW